MISKTLNQNVSLKKCKRSCHVMFNPLKKTNFIFFILCHNIYFVKRAIGN